MTKREYRVIVVGGGHAGVEAAWAAANLLGPDARGASVALVTLDPGRIGEMSCNPAIGGLAKGQLVREVDALGGVMGLAADATGIMFKVLNMSRGQAVRGPRCQCDKHAYAEAVRAFVAWRREIEVIAGRVEQIRYERGPGVGSSRRATGVVVETGEGRVETLLAPAVVLTTGTFMRGLMHTGEDRTPGGRFGEGAAVGISGALREVGFELGRLKTGTPPRLKWSSIDWESLEVQEGDEEPERFSALSGEEPTRALGPFSEVLARFPVLEQVQCRKTSTSAETHELIRANLHRAPMFSGQIEGTGPRYCPSIEDKVVRFAERESHTVFLEPESLRTDWIYCNGISTSLPREVQDAMVHAMPGCERAEILRYGYAVEYDMVRPHQIHVTGMTKLIEGLFLAGQINGTSGYEEAAAQGLVAGVNAVRWSHGQGEWVPRRDEAYIGVLMDDLVTKTPTEPYRMFTSRAEHRLMLRSDNADDRLTGVAEELGLLGQTELGALRRRVHARRREQLRGVWEALRGANAAGSRASGAPGDRAEGSRASLGNGDLLKSLRRAEATWEDVQRLVGVGFDREVLETVLAEVRYEPYIERERREVARRAETERRRIPEWIRWEECATLRHEARQALARFRPDTLGQAGRLEGITPADLTLVAVLARRAWSERGEGQGEDC
ncbi:MAG: tRNA uridine-5-carboxymethylaminomethyl(34) synthesis enzyme MnmG [Phycisphaerales bacterium]|nr:tRNA uridine-5-carboxymethylaminomethyl(34) synthesis enzyme MnmG [Phycisphaerales bacterium]